MPLGKTEPPSSDAARRDAGFLLRMLQRGESLRMPPMPTTGRQCNELRINGQNQTWRIVCTDWIPLRVLLLGDRLRLAFCQQPPRRRAAGPRNIRNGE